MDYLFLSSLSRRIEVLFRRSQSLFYWIIYSYNLPKAVKDLAILVSILILLDYLFLLDLVELYKLIPKTSLNPYFIGLSILIVYIFFERNIKPSSQSLFYWIIYSYKGELEVSLFELQVSILILLDYLFLSYPEGSARPHLFIVSILILLDYLFLLWILMLELHYIGLSQSLFYWIIYSY